MIDLRGARRVALRRRRAAAAMRHPLAARRRVGPRGRRWRSSFFLSRAAQLHDVGDHRGDQAHDDRDRGGVVVLLPRERQVVGVHVRGEVGRDDVRRQRRRMLGSLKSWKLPMIEKIVAMTIAPRRAGILMPVITRIGRRRRARPPRRARWGSCAAPSRRSACCSRRTPT